MVHFLFLLLPKQGSLLVCGGGGGGGGQAKVDNWFTKLYFFLHLSLSGGRGGVELIQVNIVWYIEVINLGFLQFIKGKKTKQFKGPVKTPFMSK